MDAFFAAIEQRDQPAYRGKPVVVGGDPRSRGVVSTCSYEARKYGIHSAMPAVTARRLCPQAIFLRPNFEKYREASHSIMKILKKHTELVEPVSLDEAYLDVTRHRYGLEDPVTVAKFIKQNIRAVTQLTSSAGVAVNLYLAKIASDMNKPDGLTVIRPEQVERILHPLPVRKIPGVGPVSEKQLHEHKIKTCGDLAKKDLRFLMGHFGKFGAVLHQRAQGLDDRLVEPNVPSKQYSMEETFSRDISDVASLRLKLGEFAKEIYSGLMNENRMGRTLILKVKYDDFHDL